MKLKDLTTNGQQEIISRIEQEERNFEKSSIWWRGKSGEACENMQCWFDEHQEFKKSVLNNQDIEEAFSKWVGVEKYGDAVKTQNQNIPQLMFYGVYKKALNDWRIVNELSTTLS